MIRTQMCFGRFLLKTATVFGLTLLVTGCSKKSSETASEADVHLRILSKDTAGKDEKVLVKICTNNAQWGIAKAYFDCENKSNISVDTVRKTIVGCDKQLAVLKDTVVIQFAPNVLGQSIFPRLRILISKKQGAELKVVDTTFKYYVVQ